MQKKYINNKHQTLSKLKAHNYAKILVPLELQKFLSFTVKIQIIKKTVNTWHLHKTNALSASPPLRNWSTKKFLLSLNSLGSSLKTVQWQGNKWSILSTTLSGIGLRKEYASGRKVDLVKRQKPIILALL